MEHQEYSKQIPNTYCRFFTNIGILISIVGGVVLTVIGANNRNDGLIGLGVIVLLGGSFISVLFAFALYGFGHLINKVDCLVGDSNKQQSNADDGVGIPLKPLKLFASTTCPHCKKVIELMDEMGVPYTRIFADQDPSEAKSLGIRNVPILVVGDDEARYAGATNIHKFLETLVSKA